MVLTFVKRPASPLHFESIKVRPEDVLYPGSEEEESADEDEREKKRLRIEILGRQYLNGRPLFIQTAGLKGPFEEGWVNPWTSKKPKYGVDDIRRFPEALPATADHLSRTTGAREDPDTVRRCTTETALLPNGLEQEAAMFTRVLEQDEPTAKRRKHTPPEETGIHKALEKQSDSNTVSRGGNHDHWLKTDRLHLGKDFREQAKSPTPTPAINHRTGRAFSIPTPEPIPVLPNSSSHAKAAQTSRFTPVDKHMATKEDESPRRLIVSPKRKEQITRTLQAKDLGHLAKARTLDPADGTTRQGYQDIKRLSQEAVRQADEGHGHPQARILFQEAASRTYQTAITPSRLEPYMSDVLVGETAASSAGLKAAPRGPRPSPCTVPPSTNLPEFRYRHVPKHFSTTSSRDQVPIMEASGPFHPRPRSESSSSSGSSEFAAALEAAQAKAASGGSSFSSSPAIANADTTSVKKNTHAMRRLTFTSSGVPDLVGPQGSSRPGPSSSIIKSPIPPKKTTVKEPKASGGSAPVAETSSKSSPRLPKNSKSTPNSVNLPEAQLVSDAPIQLARLTSMPSTNLLETDKQSPKFSNLDEGDSYFNLSTQAAVLKAERRFKEDLLDSPELIKSEPTSRTSSKIDGPEATPIANNARSRGSVGRKITKCEDSDDEELMSTQAMNAAMSPFAITTVKKKHPALTKRASFAPTPPKESPTPAPTLSPGSSTFGPFKNHSPSMSTSPSLSPPKPSLPIPLSHPDTTSKPHSSPTSFSILPNGTLTETNIYQDGQQPAEDFDISLPLDPFGTAFSTTHRNANPTLDSADLSAAIEDAGSFLGDWDVETAARKEGSSSRKRSNGTRGILSVGRGNV